MNWVLSRVQDAVGASFADSDRAVAARSVADTIAVAAAGFCTQVVRAASSAYETAGPGNTESWDGIVRASHDDAAFVDAVAAHALDFDDVDSISSAHLSCVVVPALLAEQRILPEQELLDAVLAASVAAQHFATWFGPEHYRRGWHATSTIGTLAACVALARVRGLDEQQLRHAVAIAASQMGGLQGNFGFGAKALHAGFAAVSARRSVTLAKCGITGAPDLLSHGSLLRNFGSFDGNTRDEPPPQSAHVALAERQLIKLFPCCFAIHRAVAATLRAKRELGDTILGANVRFEILLPASSYAILRTEPPRNGTEAAFSPAYCCAAALRDGGLEVRNFDEDFASHGVVELASRFALLAGTDAAEGGLLDRPATLRVNLPGREALSFTELRMPGSHADPDRDARLRAKIATCLERYRLAENRIFPGLDRIAAMPQVASFFA